MDSAFLRRLLELPPEWQMLLCFTSIPNSKVVVIGFPLSPTQCLPHYVADLQRQSVYGPTIGGVGSSLRR
ncbi:hypothetical protein U1Q18_017439, partial [Sarracenia purpurea var. burkii]